MPSLLRLLPANKFQDNLEGLDLGLPLSAGTSVQLQPKGLYSKALWLLLGDGLVFKAPNDAQLDHQAT